VAKTTGQAIESVQGLSSLITEITRRSVTEAVGIVENKLKYRRW
jgi:hypothetical protein